MTAEIARFSGSTTHSPTEISMNSYTLDMLSVLHFNV